MQNDEQIVVNLPEVNHVVYVDELEVEATADSDLMLYFFGIVVPRGIGAELEALLLEILSKFDALDFHARKLYNKAQSVELPEQINALFISYGLQLVCFPFVKRWLDEPWLATLNQIDYPEVPQMRVRNYRSQALLLFVHVLNHYFIKNEQIDFKALLIMDKNWLKAGQMIVHSGEKLNRLHNMAATRLKSHPLLTLPDHAGYLYLTLMREQKKQTKDTTNDDNSTKSQLHKLAETLFIKAGLFKVLDVKEWIHDENRK